MKFEVDLDLLKKSSILGNVMPVLFTKFKNEVKGNKSMQGRNDYSGCKKRKLVELFEIVYDNILVTAEKDKFMKKIRNRDELDILIQLASATDIYETTKELNKKYKEYMEIESLNIICLTFTNNLLLNMKDELNRLKRYEIFDSIELKLKGEANEI